MELCLASHVYEMSFNASVPETFPAKVNGDQQVKGGRVIEVGREGGNMGKVAEKANIEAEALSVLTQGIEHRSSS